MEVGPNQMLMVYNPTTGAGIYTVEFPVQGDLTAALDAAGQSYVVAPKALVTDLVVTGNPPTAQLRPDMGPFWRTTDSVTANGTDVIFLDNIPEGASVSVDGEFIGTVGADGSMDFGAEHPGSYSVTLTLWPYRTYLTYFTAT